MISSLRRNPPSGLSPRNPPRRAAALAANFALAGLLAIACLANLRPNAFAIAHRSERRSSLPAAHALVVGYFGQWSVYDHFLVKNLVTSGAAAQLDQINYAQGFVTGGHCSVADPNADLNLVVSAQDSVDGTADDPATTFRGNLHQIAELKRLHPRLKILISLEGRASDFAADAQPAARNAFIQSCIDIFLRGHLSASPNVASGTPDQPGLFDGIDVDWEYPGPENAANFVALLTDLRHAMDDLRPGLRLAIAVGPSPRMYPGVDLSAVSRVVDQIGIMNYDYSGPWSHTTGLLAPLYAPHRATGGSPIQSPGAAPDPATIISVEGPDSNVEASILAYKQAGVPAAKLLLGLPFYGYGWKSVNASAAGLFQPGQGIRGDRPYSYLQNLLTPAPATVEISDPLPHSPPAASPAPAQSPLQITAQTSIQTSIRTSPQLPGQISSHTPKLAPATIARTYVLHRDPRSHAPWIYDGDTFWTYEDPISIRYKANFAANQHLGGVMAWELSQDAPDAALLKAARSTLLHPDLPLNPD